MCMWGISVGSWKVQEMLRMIPNSRESQWGGRTSVSWGAAFRSTHSRELHRTFGPAWWRSGTVSMACRRSGEGSNGLTPSTCTFAGRHGVRILTNINLLNKLINPKPWQVQFSSSDPSTQSVWPSQRAKLGMHFFSLWQRNPLLQLSQLRSSSPPTQSL